MSNDRKPAVLIVDDEEIVLISIRTLLALDDEYEVATASSPEAALKLLESQTVDVTISDYMMPGMNGIQLLGRAKEIQPETTRVLLTGHADKGSAIKAINEVGLFQYLEKPWDNAQLLLVVRHAVERARLLRELRTKIGELDMAHSTLKDVQVRLLKAFL